MSNVSEILLSWFTEYKRDLPWRNTRDPYLIWVSEIILQQTQVKQGLPYYNRFVQKFPNVNALARASEDDILKLWQGLGYYSRARNMQFTAKYITENLKGKFPNTFSEIIKLKGIGDYTGAAIASFCFDEVVPVVDGNVFRFISRYFGIEKPIDELKTKREIKAICEEIIPSNNPATFNQAIMEFGALQCTPKNTDCSNCPLRDSCWAFKNDRVKDLPFKAKKIKKRDRFFYYLVLDYDDKTLIRKRSGNDIWKGLYEYPFIEKTSSISESDVLKESTLRGIKIKHITDYKKHVLSHQNLYAKFIYANVNEIEFNKASEHFSSIRIDKKIIDTYAFPRLIENQLEDGMI